MNCKNCGTSIKENQTVCECCGMPVDLPEKPSDAKQTVQRSSSSQKQSQQQRKRFTQDACKPGVEPIDQTQTKQKKSNRTLLIVVPIVALLLVAAVVMIILFRGKTDRTESNAGETPVQASEPTVEEPIVEEPIVEEPAVEEPTVVDPIVEEPSAEIVGRQLCCWRQTGWYVYLFR